MKGRQVSLGGPAEAPPGEAVLVPSTGACSRKQRKEAGSGLPGEWGARAPTAPGATPQVLRPCKVFRDIDCLSWNHSEKCVQLCSLSR